jgi:hypothetical protein
MNSAKGTFICTAFYKSKIKVKEKSEKVREK